MKPKLIVKQFERKKSKQMLQILNENKKFNQQIPRD